MISRTEVGEAVLAEIGTRIYTEWRDQQEENAALRRELAYTRKELELTAKAYDTLKVNVTSLKEDVENARQMAKAKDSMIKAQKEMLAELRALPPDEEKDLIRKVKKKGKAEDTKPMTVTVLPEFVPEKALRTGRTDRFDEETGKLMTYGYRPTRIGQTTAKYERPSGRPILVMKREVNSVPAFSLGSGDDAFMTTRAKKAVLAAVPVLQEEGATEACERGASQNIAATAETVNLAKCLCERTGTPMTELIRRMMIAATVNLTEEKDWFMARCDAAAKDKRNKNLHGYAPRGMLATFSDICNEKGVTQGAVMAAQIEAAAKESGIDSQAADAPTMKPAVSMAAFEFYIGRSPKIQAKKAAEARGMDVKDLYLEAIDRALKNEPEATDVIETYETKSGWHKEGRPGKVYLRMPAKTRKAFIDRVNGMSGPDKTRRCVIEAYLYHMISEQAQDA